MTSSLQILLMAADGLQPHGLFDGLEIPAWAEYLTVLAVAVPVAVASALAPIMPLPRRRVDAPVGGGIDRRAVDARSDRRPSAMRKATRPPDDAAAQRASRRFRRPRGEPCWGAW
jgi:hypothetical protein